MNTEEQRMIIQSLQTLKLICITHREENYSGCNNCPLSSREGICLIGSGLYPCDYEINIDLEWKALIND